VSDDDSRISRRTLLYGLTTAGIGAGTGVTAATLSDTEPFGGNLLSSGEVDLKTCWENKNDDNCKPVDDSPQVDIGSVSKGDAGSGLIRVKNDGNNRAWVCLRTPCPSDNSGLEEDLDVTVWRDEDCNAEVNDATPLTSGASGTLGEVLTTLHEGVLIDGDLSTSDPDPFKPGDEACIGFKWKLTGELNEDDSVNVNFEFSATQSRSTTPQDVCQPKTPCGGPSESKGISFVAFCSSGGFTGNPITSFSTAKRNTGGEPVAVDWESDEPVDTVVIKTGPGPDALYNFPVGDATFGTTELDTKTDSPNPGPQQSPQSPCPDGSSGVKYEYEESTDTWDEP
jgi:hypothetical protein